MNNNIMSKNWLFTLNNPSGNDIPKSWVDVTYCVWQLEKGDRGTPHLQGYVVFTTRKRLASVKKIAKNKGHWEIRKGTHSQAVNYCTKSDSRVDGPWTIGDDKEIAEGQGSRSDLMAVKEAIDGGKSEVYVMDNHFKECCKYMKFFKEYKRAKTPKRTWKSEVEVLWGPTGTGKSHYCAVNYPDAYWKPKSDWWDGYDLHETVVIDEFYGWLSYEFLLRLLDKYPLIVQTKFGHAQFVAKKIIFTSNTSPEQWYKHPNCHWEPLKRRIETIHHFGIPYVPDTTPSSSTPSTSYAHSGIHPSDMPTTIDADSG